MANGKSKISYNEYKNFSDKEKDLYHFTGFSKLHDLPDLFAKKWVERAMITMVTVACLSVLGAIVGTVVIASGG